MRPQYLSCISYYTDAHQHTLTLSAQHKPCIEPGHTLPQTTQSPPLAHRDRPHLQRDFTCDVKPQGGRALLQGHHSHDLSHLVILHDGEIVDWLIEEEWQSGGRRSTDPLNVQASCGGLLRTAVVYHFDLKRKAQKLHYKLGKRLTRVNHTESELNCPIWM